MSACTIYYILYYIIIKHLNIKKRSVILVICLVIPRNPSNLDATAANTQMHNSRKKSGGDMCSTCAIKKNIIIRRRILCSFRNYCFVNRIICLMLPHRIQSNKRRKIWKKKNRKKTSVLLFGYGKLVDYFIYINDYCIWNFEFAFFFVNMELFRNKHTRWDSQLNIYRKQQSIKYI